MPGARRCWARSRHTQSEWVEPSSVQPPETPTHPQHIHPELYCAANLSTAPAVAVPCWDASPWLAAPWPCLAAAAANLVACHNAAPVACQCPPLLDLHALQQHQLRCSSTSEAARSTGASLAAQDVLLQVQVYCLLGSADCLYCWCCCCCCCRPASIGCCCTVPGAAPGPPCCQPRYDMYV